MESKEHNFIITVILYQLREQICMCRTYGQSQWICNTLHYCRNSHC